MWYHAQLSLLRFALTAVYFKRLSFIMTKNDQQINDNARCYDKRIKMSKHKKIPSLFLFLEGQMYLYPSVYFQFHAKSLLQNNQIF